MDFSSCSHLSALMQQNTGFAIQDPKSLTENKCGLVSMVSKANQPFFISLSDMNPLEIQGGGINWNNSFSLYLDPAGEPQVLNTSHVIQKLDDYHLALIRHFDTRQSEQHGVIVLVLCARLLVFRQKRDSRPPSFASRWNSFSENTAR